MANDYSRAIVAGVLSDLTDRSGIKHAIQSVDKDIQEEIFNTLVGIVEGIKDARIAALEAENAALKAVMVGVANNLKECSKETETDIPHSYMKDLSTKLRKAANS